MIKTFLNWWNRDKIERERIYAQIATLSESVAEFHAADVASKQVIEELNTELTAFRTQAAEDDERRNGTTPWVEIKSDKVSPTKGIELELDWNDAFVEYLRDNGFVAEQDEQVVQTWLLMVYKELMDNLEDKSIEKSDFHQPQVFE